MKPGAVTLALCLLAAPARAADPSTVTTHAVARDRLPNTVADVVLAVESRARTVAEVQAALTTGTTVVLAYLTDAKVTRLRSQGITVQPEIDYTPGMQQRVLGYKGRATVAFQVDAPRLGAVVGSALAHGANAIDSTSVHPTEAEMDAARQRLAAAATRIAVAQARAVAEAAGMRPGSVLRILVDPTQAQSMPGPMMLAASAPAPAGPGVPIATVAGDSEVVSNVTATVTLLEP